MIITRTPLRVSFLGGGSDYPTFFREEPGAVFGTGIDLYVYVFIVPNSPLAEKRFRLTYRLSEAVDLPSEFQHPLVRTVMQNHYWDDSPIHIATMADVPANTGLGSSSSFTVGLLKALAVLRKHDLDPLNLALEAVRVERDLLGEAGGWQDQFHAAFGGLALYEFIGKTVSRNSFDNSIVSDALADSLVLVPSGEPRASHEYAAIHNSGLTSEYARSTTRKLAHLARETFVELRAATSSQAAIEVLADALRQSWELKLSLSPGNSNDAASSLIRYGLSKGALAGKLCGAGGTGFVAFLVPNGTTSEFVQRAGFNIYRPVGVAQAGVTMGPVEWL